MPYKCEHIRLTGLQDRRRKLTDEQKEEIRQLYATGLASQRSLSQRFHVSRSLIAIIVSPDRAEKEGPTP